MKRRKMWQIIPDLLTLSRPFLGLTIGLLGVFGGRATLSTAVLLLVVGWTTDVADGQLARWAKQKCQRRESWIGRNEIRADSLMLVGVLVYLGYIQVIPVWLSVSYASILFILTVTPSTYHQIMLFEAPATIATFLLLVILAGRPTLGYVIIWGFLVLLYDWKRAMQLAGVLKSILETHWRKISQRPFYHNFWFGSFVVVVIIGAIALSFGDTQTRVVGGIVEGLLIMLAYLAWARL